MGGTDDGLRCGDLANGGIESSHCQRMEWPSTAEFSGPTNDVTL